ncbi:HNH endonuclease [Halogeometricum sp. S1BR25-6]|uniref:HNH endonuclease n=1 Tax=Halogeometricum salsisoli TaxID=2950536 RepID=A0ABU2GBU5_9EURY|nr:HNH endonuclease [Halogeometricum sp. S1BR25-6]MDS0298286.1 HNH endonuclease [Halogeometricum sp. S1BR25-6]
MRLADLELEPGAAYEAAELREAFDRRMTGRGIEICYDDDDRRQRYLRLFSTDAGPYEDDVTGGQFTYVGEGQNGDQTLTGGNRYLANAAESPLPIFFFHRGEGESAWEYQGQVDVLACDEVEYGGRTVYQFTLQRRSEKREGIDREEAASDLDAPERVETTRTRIVRNTPLATALKRRYDFACQVCGETRRRGAGEDDGYAEAHHVRPLGRPHDGPDAESNLLVLCPNHHADFDYGTVAVDPESYRIAHAYDAAVDGETLFVRGDHALDARFLDYHNREVADF